MPRRGRVVLARAGRRSRRRLRRAARPVVPRLNRSAWTGCRRVLPLRRRPGGEGCEQRRHRAAARGPQGDPPRVQGVREGRRRRHPQGAAAHR